MKSNIWSPVRLNVQLIGLSALLFAMLMLAACGRDEPPPSPTSAPAPAPTATPVPPPPTAAPTAVPTAAPATEPAVSPPASPLAVPPESPLVTPEQTDPETGPDAGADTVTDTVNAEETAAVLMPLEVDEGTDCEIESNLDLAGYPDLEAKMGCPTKRAVFEPIAINEFGTGPDFDRFMLWFSDENQIYVLYPDGTWKTFPDTWQEGDPTFTCNPLDVEPDSPPLPRRGFGKVWCTEPGLQEIMGTVPREERLCQYTVLQHFETGRLLACFEDATVRYFRLLNDGTWDVTVQ